MQRVEAELGDRRRAASPIGARLRLSVGVLQHDAAGRDRILDRAHDQSLAELRSAPVAKGDDFGKVVPGVDVQQRKRKSARAERLFGEAQQHQRILAAGKEQRGIAALAGDLAQDVDRLRLEPAEVVGIGRRRARVDRRTERACCPIQESRLVTSRAPAVADAAAARCD